MQALHDITRLTVLLVCCLLAATAMPQQAGTSGNKRSKPAARATAGHPEVDPAQDCASCHDAQYKQWDESRHATGGVLCLICHGSVSENFVKQPAMMRCQGCHSAQVESLAASASTRKSGNRCFTCHAPHTLKLKKQGVKRPHASVGLGETQ